MSFAQSKTGNKTALFTAALLFFGVIFSTAHTGAKGPDAPPLAVIEQTTVKFPPVIAGAEVEHRFTVKNTGSARLDIINVYTG